MKAFEEYWNNLNVPADCFMEPGRVWRAALEWVQTRITESLGTASYDENVACVKQIENDIKEELKVESNKSTTKASNKFDSAGIMAPFTYAGDPDLSEKVVEEEKNKE